MPDPLDRRDFLKTSCAIASAAALSVQATASAAAEPAERKFKKAVKLSMAQGNLSVVEKFKMLKELGFDGIHVDQRDDHGEVRRAR
jgi:hexulose-6-phosphate isomerase